jgi:hypothetical protein
MCPNKFAFLIFSLYICICVLRDFEVFNLTKSEKFIIFIIACREFFGKRHAQSEVNLSRVSPLWLYLEIELQNSRL